MMTHQTGAGTLPPPWRKEPEIPQERQLELAAALRTPPDIGRGLYPFKGMKLSRADIEWLLAARDGGPVDGADTESRKLAGLDLRGAVLSNVDLSNLPLARLIGGLDSEQGAGITTDQRKQAAIYLEMANLRGADLRGAVLFNAHLEGAALQGANLAHAHLRWADLSDANMRKADLSGADLGKTHFQGANIHFAIVAGLNLSGAFMSSGTNIQAAFGPQGVFLADVDWNGVRLQEVEWGDVRLAEEQEALRTHALDDYKRAVRANRQLASALQSQDLNEESVRFAYRARQLQRVVWRKQRRPGKYLASLLLDAVAGYGYRPARSFLTYACAIAVFMTVYHLLGGIAWNEALVVSMTAFHGRGFFPGTFSPADPLAFVSAIEALVGLIIEVTFIATLTQRLFGK